MTMGTSIPMDEIRGLVDERARYETWLGALAERRASTPAHVFERVHADYDGRLRRVMDALALHVQPLRDAAAELDRAHDERSRELAMRHDDLAEAELRMLVGEFPADEGERRRQQAAQEIQRLEGERDDYATRLADVRELLGRASPGDERDLATVGADAPQGVERAESAAPAAGAAAPVADAEVPRSTVGDVDGRALAGEVGAERHFAPPIRPVTPPGGGIANLGGELAGGFAGGYGEQRPTAPSARSAGSFVPEVGPLVTPTASFGAQSSPEANPQQRTLRCGECGEMNFPTEWYCERCGGELAAM